MSGDQDLLERATRALRETTSPTDKELADGKAVLLWAQRGAQKKKRNRTLRWVLPLAAMLTAGSALAATEPGQRLARAVIELVAPARDQAARERPRKAPARPHDAPRVADASPPPPPVVPVPPEPPAIEPAAPRVAAQDASASATPRKEGSRRVAPPVPVAPRAEEEAVATEPEPLPEPEGESVRKKGEPPSSADLARYRAAHTAHFKDRDFAAALAAWDVYLHEFPQGTFVIEARYNRAICLLRLGRTDQARYALRPFARGEIGHGYRQAEATKLLEALE